MAAAKTQAAPDPMEVLAALGVLDSTAAVPVHGGADTAIWRVERGGAAYALRLFRAEQAETYRREVVAMQAAGAAGIPVPQIHAEGTWQDRPALLLSWCDGRPLSHELRERPWGAWSLGVAFGRMQAQIHLVPAPSALCPPKVDWIRWAGPAEEPLQTRLRALSPSSDALLHLDYHPLNVMTDGSRVTGVLDWANARAGDPRADIARTLTILRLTPMRPGVTALPELMLRRLLELGWRRGYRQEDGAFQDMALFYAWAGAVMERDLAPRLGKPGTGLEAHHFARIRRWTALWKRRAGVVQGDSGHT